MAVSINSNILSLNTQRNLSRVTDQQSLIQERLASGRRINRASDDAAGLAISSSLQTDSRIYTQGIRNINDGLSLLNIAQGSLQQLSTITLRQIELAEQSANGSYSTRQRRSLASESNALTAEFNRIVQSASFNGRQLIDGSLISGLRIQAGMGINGSLAMNLGEKLARTVGDGTYQSGSQFASPTNGGGQEQMRTADLNGDGFADIVASSFYGNVVVIMGNGDGTFKAAATYSTGYVQGRTVETGDFNGDGIIDVAFGATAGVGVMLGNGDGTFGNIRTFNVGDVQGVVVSDVDGDGKSDFQITDGSANIVTYFGNGNGTFGRITTTSSGIATSLAHMQGGDADGDGRIDLFVASTSGVFVFISNGNGTFKGAVTLSTTWSNDLWVGDINNDGFAEAGWNDASNGLRVNLNNGDGTFRSTFSTAISAGSSQRSVVMADLNGDGYLDLMNTNQGAAGYFTTWLGNGDGTFRMSQSTAINNGAGIVAADFSGDGAVDLVVNDTFGTDSLYKANTQQTTLEAQTDIYTQSSARKTLDLLRSQLTRVSSELGAIGALQSRLGVATNVLAVGRDNYLGAESRIGDTDVAQDSAELVKTQILQKVGAAILAQANLAPQLALKLLQ